MDIFKPSPIRITGELRQRVNQISHAYGVAQGLRYRDELIARLKDAAELGADYAALHQMLDALEAKP